jgi:hypothetical protein
VLLLAQARTRRTRASPVALCTLPLTREAQRRTGAVVNIDEGKW